MLFIVWQAFDFFPLRTAFANINLLLYRIGNAQMQIRDNTKSNVCIYLN